MLSFSQKLVLTYLIAFFVFFAILFPFVSKSVEALLKQRLLNISSELVDKAKDADSVPEMIQILRHEEFSVVFRVSLLNAEGQILYDSHLERLLGRKISPGKPSQHPEVTEALKKGVGYSENYSALFGEKYIYLARAFQFQDTTYVLRMAFPAKQMHDLTHKFEVGFFLLAMVVLFLFASMTWLILNRITRPIRKIIKTIKSYKLHREENLPNISLGSRSKNDEFQKLADTINTLNHEIQKKINAITIEKKEKSSVLETLDEGVLSTDKDLIVTYANFMALQLFNLKKSEVENQYLLDVIPKIPENLQDPLKRLINESQQYSKTLEETIRIGEARFIDLIATPKRKDAGLVVVVQDKTLHNQVIEMGKQFVANASHELKTPITIIRGFAETLHDNPNLKESQMLEITDKIVRNCEKMDSLIKTLLTLSEIENFPRERLQECNLMDIVKRAQISVSSVHPEALFEFIQEKVPYRIKADPNLLELALYNLFDNAIKYSKDHPKITLEFQLKDQATRLKITDNGIGIPNEDLQHIYQRFFNVDKSKSKKMGGVGLGLSIVKTIIDKHRASIDVSSIVNKGTTFTITFPEVH